METIESVQPLQSNTDRISSEALSSGNENNNELQTKSLEIQEILYKIQEVKKNIHNLENTQRYARLENIPQTDTFRQMSDNVINNLVNARIILNDCLTELEKVKKFLEDENCWWKMLKSRENKCCSLKIPHIHGFLDGAAIILRLSEETPDEYHDAVDTASQGESHSELSLLDQDSEMKDIEDASFAQEGVKSELLDYVDIKPSSNLSFEIHNSFVIPQPTSESHNSFPNPFSNFEIHISPVETPQLSDSIDMSGITPNLNNGSLQNPNWELIDENQDQVISELPMADDEDNRQDIRDQVRISNAEGEEEGEQKVTEIKGAQGAGSWYGKISQAVFGKDPSVNSGADNDNNESSSNESESNTQSRLRKRKLLPEMDGTIKMPRTDF